MNRKLYLKPRSGSFVLTADWKEVQCGWYLNDVVQLKHQWNCEGWPVEGSDKDENWQLLCPVAIMEWEDDS